MMKNFFLKGITYYSTCTILYDEWQFIWNKDLKLYIYCKNRNAADLQEYTWQ